MIPFYLDRHLKFSYWSAFFIFWLFLAFPFPSFGLYLQLDTIADVKTNFSDGCASIKDIGNQSERLGIDAVIFGDYARNSIEFGPNTSEFEFEELIKKTVEPEFLQKIESEFIGLML